jgi:hypothetical protein
MNGGGAVTMDPAALVGFLILVAVAAAAWSRPGPIHDVGPRATRRVIVEEIDDQGRVTRRVVL